MNLQKNYHFKKKKNSFLSFYAGMLSDQETQVQSITTHERKMY